METITTKVPIQKLHLEHELWGKEFLFYREELVILNKYLTEIATRNTSSEVLKGVEHFQNQFIRQKEVLDELKHDVRQSEKELVNKLAGLNEIQGMKLKVDEQEDLRDAVNTYKKIYAELKAEFFFFLSKWM